MWTDQEIAYMREAQRQLMGDHVVISRAGGERWDEEAQQSVEETETVYEGPGRLAADPAPSVLGSDGSVRQDQVFMLTVPHTVTLAPADRVQAGRLIVWVNQVQKNSFPATATRAECSATSQGAA